MNKLVFGAAVAVLASGCVFTRPVNAWSPLAINVGSPDTSFIDNSVKPEKVGRATATGIVFYTEGDSSLKAAMDNGGITKVHHVDYEVKNIFGIVGSTTTVVYGE